MHFCTSVSARSTLPAPYTSVTQCSAVPPRFEKCHLIAVLSTNAISIVRVQVPLAASPGQRQRPPQAAQRDVGSEAATQLFQDAPAGTHAQEGGKTQGGVLAPVAAGFDSGPPHSGVADTTVQGATGRPLINGRLPPPAQQVTSAASHSGLNGTAHLPGTLGAQQPVSAMRPPALQKPPGQGYAAGTSHVAATNGLRAAGGAVGGPGAGPSAAVQNGDRAGSGAGGVAAGVAMDLQEVRHYSLSLHRTRDHAHTPRAQLCSGSADIIDLIRT